MKYEEDFYACFLSFYYIGFYLSLHLSLIPSALPEPTDPSRI